MKVFLRRTILAFTIIFSFTFLSGAFFFERLTDAGFYKDTFGNEENFEQVTNAVFDDLSEDEINRILDEIKNENGTVLDQESVQKLISLTREEIIDSEFQILIPKLISGNAEFFLDYIKGNEPELFLYFPRQEMLEALDVFALEFQPVLSDFLLNSEFCSDQEGKCLSDEEKIDLNNDFLTSFNEFYVDLKEGLTQDSYLWTEEGIIKATDLIDLSSEDPIEAKQNVSDFEQSLEILQNLYRITWFMLAGLFVLIVLSLIAVLFLGERTIERISRNIGFFLTANGTLILLSYGSWWIRGVSAQADFLSDWIYETEAEKEIARVMAELMNNLFAPISIFGIFISVLGALIWIFLPKVYIKYQQRNASPQPVKEGAITKNKI